MYDRRVVALRPSRAKSAIDVFRKGNSSGVKAERSTASLPHLGRYSTSRRETAKCPQPGPAAANRVKPRAKWVTCGRCCALALSRLSHETSPLPRARRRGRRPQRAGPGARTCVALAGVSAASLKSTRRTRHTRVPFGPRWPLRDGCKCPVTSRPPTLRHNSHSFIHMHVHGVLEARETPGDRRCSTWVVRGTPPCHTLLDA